MKKLESLWTNIELFIVGLFSLSAAFIGFYGIVMRYVFIKPIGWTEEIITYLLVWSLLIVISPVQKYNEHISVDILYNRYPEKVKFYVQFIILVLSFIFSLVVIYYSWQLVESFMKLNQVSQSSLRFPLWIVRLSVPVGFTLLALRFIQSAMETVRHYKNSQIKDIRREADGRSVNNNI